MKLVLDFICSKKSSTVVVHYHSIMIRLEDFQENILIVYQNRSESKEICMVMTVHQGASGSLMEKED